MPCRECVTDTVTPSAPSLVDLGHMPTLTTVMKTDLWVAAEPTELQQKSAPQREHILESFWPFQKMLFFEVA